MKIFKFPAARIVDQDTINTAKNCGFDRQPLNKSPKLAHFKKTGSLDLSYCFSKKKKQLQKIYRVNSCQKKSRNKSSSSLKSTNEPKQTIKPSYQKQSIPTNNSKQNTSHHNPGHNHDKKIILNTQKKGKYLCNDLKINIQLFIERLQKCLISKSDKIFQQEYTNAMKFYHLGQTKQNNDEILYDLVQKICRCQQRKNDKKYQVYSQKITLLEKQKSALSIQVKKNKIKQQVLNQQIKKITDKNIELVKQIRKYKEKTVNTQSTQTQTLQCYNQIVDRGPFVNQFPKLLLQLKNMKQKENHMNILVGQLQRDGLNLEKIYKKGVKYTKKQNNEQNIENQQQESSQSQRYAEYIQKSKKPKINNQVSVHRNVNDGSDADNSIIDEMQAISFDYKDKQNQMQAYTPRNVYICKKQLDEDLKRKLQLNFQCLYEDQQSQQSYGTGKDFPTI